MKKLVLFAFLCAAVLAFAADAAPKYIFLFIGDGMSTPQRMVAEEFATLTGYGPLAINHFEYQCTTRTASTSSLVTDSAAAATAIACGEKTANGRIGVASDDKRVLESVAEVAKQAGKKVGIVTSVTINHATPAGFYGHRPNRSQYYALGLDLIASGFDYFGGGGVAEANKTDDPEYKGDIYTLAAEAGYKVVSDAAGLAALTAADGKVLARGADGSLPYAIDADEKSEGLTLADFTRKGIELLDNPNGFFMMVEGGMIDYHGHSNDAAGNLFEVLDFDRAVKVAMEFAAQHPEETLIVTTGDHETGGMTMGFAGSGYSMNVELLANQKCSVNNFAHLFSRIRRANPDMTFEDAKVLLRKYFGFKFEGEGPMVLSEAQVKTLSEAFETNNLPNTSRQVICALAGIGWTTGAHTGLPVLTTAAGCSAEIFTGFIDNTDIAKKLKSLMR